MTLQSHIVSWLLRHIRENTDEEGGDNIVTSTSLYSEYEDYCKSERITSTTMDCIHKILLKLFPKVHVLSGSKSTIGADGHIMRFYKGLSYRREDPQISLDFCLPPFCLSQEVSMRVTIATGWIVNGERLLKEVTMLNSGSWSLSIGGRAIELERLCIGNNLRWSLSEIHNVSQIVEKIPVCVGKLSRRPLTFQDSPLNISESFACTKESEKNSLEIRQRSSQCLRVISFLAKEPCCVNCLRDIDAPKAKGDSLKRPLKKSLQRSKSMITCGLRIETTLSESKVAEALVLSKRDLASVSQASRNIPVQCTDKTVLTRDKMQTTASNGAPKKFAVPVSNAIGNASTEFSSYVTFGSVQEASSSNTPPLQSNQVCSTQTCGKFSLLKKQTAIDLSSINSSNASHLEFVPQNLALQNNFHINTGALLMPVNGSAELNKAILLNCPISDLASLNSPHVKDEKVKSPFVDGTIVLTSQSQSPIFLMCNYQDEKKASNGFFRLSSDELPIKKRKT